MRRGYTKGLRYTIDLTKIADRANPRTVQAPIAYSSTYPEPIFIDWGDGTPPETITVGLRPEHTYASGAGDVFTVIIRSVTGNFPNIAFNNTLTPTNPANNITLAIVSVDHFYGRIRDGAFVQQSPYLSGCVNVEYVDTRFQCQPNYRALFALCHGCVKLTQPIESWCFDFCAANDNNTFQNAFNGCVNMPGSPEELFIQNTGVKNNPFSYTFNNCKNLTGKPFVFWKEDGSLDTDKFPDMIGSTATYTGCSDALRAQVPEAYGGTMAVS